LKVDNTVNNEIRNLLILTTSDFNYVRQIPWDLSSCQSGLDSAGVFCETLLLLISVGVAQHLKDSSVFMFPDYASANACVNEFQEQVTSLMPTVSLSSLIPTAVVSPLLSVCLNTSLFDEILCATKYKRNTIGLIYWVPLQSIRPARGICPT